MSLLDRYFVRKTVSWESKINFSRGRGGFGKILKQYMWVTKDKWLFYDGCEPSFGLLL